MSKYTSTVVRLVSLLVSGLSTILIANFIIEFSGETEFARYSLLIGITALLPFIDFGIGYKVNSLILDHHARNNLNIRLDLSRCFTWLLIIWLVFSSLALILFTSHNFDIATFLALELDDQKLILTILLLTFANLPLSLGSRILMADGKILIPLLASLVGTVLTLATLPIFFKLDPSQTKYLSVIPIFVMVSVNIYLFFYAQYKTVFRVKLILNLSRLGSVEIFSYGLTATLTSSFIPIILQFPKYILGNEGRVMEVAQYSLFLLFLQPIVTASTFSLLAALPDIRRSESERKQLGSIFRAYSFSLTVGLILSLLYLLVSELPLSFPVNFPEKQLGLLLLALVPFQILRHNFTATFTGKRNLFLFLITFSFSLLVVIPLQQFKGATSAFGAIISIVLLESILSCLLSIVFMRKHMSFLKKAVYD